MTKYKLAIDERETTINWSDGDKNASIITHNTILIKKLRKLNVRELWSDNDFIPECVEFQVPIFWIKINPPRTRILTNEQREAIGQKMKNARQKSGATIS